ncbi:general transcription factor IIE subunit 1 [Patella vulgata]|uniref:general transcription factor IIE subunit 1 n=1 Tax=Patella vulgata TaxID=6465 RepID=UPI0021804B74|nr:general transcription factor IIE subunit 1 [Patella vulgata]
MDSDTLLTEVPEPLKRLTRLIVRGFYSKQHAIVIDIIVRLACIKEDDMIELLKFERKQLRALINTLKNDKFVKAQMRVETDAEGKTTRHNYYFVNYNVFVNVVKYKLDHVRRKIEMEERDNTSRASFKCPSCMKTYTDLEAGQLLDFMTQTLKCTYCNTEVEEDETSMPKQDARTMLAKFNEQIQPIYDLLKECEDYKLAPEVLAPEPVDLKKNLRNQNAGGSKSASDRENATWSGESTRNIGFNYSESSVTINMRENDFTSPTKDKKERPVWMTTSTVDGIPMLDAKEDDASKAEVGTSHENNTPVSRDDIMQTLLVHEPKASTAGGLPSARGEDSSSSDSDEDKPTTSAGVVEEMESDDDDEAVAMVIIGDKKVPLHEVTDSMVAQMTPAEKEEYIRLSQEMYEDMYE